MAAAKSMMAVFVVLAVVFAAVGAQEVGGMAPAPSPDMATGAGFSLQIPTAVVGFSVFLSLFSLLSRH